MLSVYGDGGRVDVSLLLWSKEKGERVEMIDDVFELDLRVSEGTQDVMSLARWADRCSVQARDLVDFTCLPKLSYYV
jgi:hypothetical protein